MLASCWPLAVQASSVSFRRSRAELSSDCWIIFPPYEPLFSTTLSDFTIRPWYHFDLMSASSLTLVDKGGSSRSRANCFRLWNEKWLSHCVIGNKVNSHCQNIFNLKCHLNLRLTVAKWQIYSSLNLRRNHYPEADFEGFSSAHMQPGDMTATKGQY